MKGMFYALLVVFTIAIIVPPPPISIGVASATSSLFPITKTETLIENIIDEGYMATKTSSLSPITKTKTLFENIIDEGYMATKQVLKPNNLYTVNMEPKHQDTSFISSVEILGRSHVEAVTIRLVDFSQPTLRSRLPIFDDKPDCAIVSYHVQHGVSQEVTGILFALSDNVAKACRIRLGSENIHYNGVIQNSNLRHLFRAQFQYALSVWADDNLDLYVQALENGVVSEKGVNCFDSDPDETPFVTMWNGWQISTGDIDISFHLVCTAGGNIGGVFLFIHSDNIFVSNLLFISRAHPRFMQIKDPIETFLDQF